MNRQRINHDVDVHTHRVRSGGREVFVARAGDSIEWPVRWLTSTPVIGDLQFRKSWWLGRRLSVRDINGTKRHSIRVGWHHNQLHRFDSEASATGQTEIKTPVVSHS